MSIEALRTIAPLLKQLTIGELEAVKDMAYDLKFSLEKAEKEAFKQMVKECEGAK